MSEAPEISASVVEAAARAAHEVNRAYCLAIGDASQPPWEGAPEWQRASCREGVAGVIAGNGPRESHASWMRHKLEHGWTYGPDKDPGKKTHPCLVPYDELPPAQRAKDDLFVRTVGAVLRALQLIDL